MNNSIWSRRLNALLVITFFLSIPHTLADTVPQDNSKNMAVDPAPRSAVDPAPRSAGIVGGSTGYTQPYTTPIPPEIDKNQYEKVPAGVEQAPTSGGGRKITNFWRKAEKQPPKVES